MDIALLRTSFERLRPRADDVAARFYERMFAVYPQVRPLFARVDPAEQRSKLMASLATVVALVDRADELGPILEGLGRRHAAYGVEAHHYAYVGASLLATLAEALGDEWTVDLARTWATAVQHVSELMIEAQRRAA